MKPQTSNIIAILYTKEVIIAAIAVVAIGVHLFLRFGVETSGTAFGVESQGFSAACDLRPLAAHSTA